MEAVVALTRSLACCRFPLPVMLRLSGRCQQRWSGLGATATPKAPTCDQVGNDVEKAEGRIKLERLFPMLRFLCEVCSFHLLKSHSNLNLMSMKVCYALYRFACLSSKSCRHSILTLIGEARDMLHMIDRQITCNTQSFIV